MVPAIKDIQNLKSAHLIGKPEFGAVIESNVSKKQKLFVQILSRKISKNSQTRIKHIYSINSSLEKKLFVQTLSRKTV